MSNNPLISRGMANVAFEAYKIASKNANIDIDTREDMRLVQGLGHAKASAGFHERDGTLDGYDYTAAADFSVRGLNYTQVATWIDELCEAGFPCFFRHGEKWTGNEHIHGNYAGLPQKDELDQQQEDFFDGKDGLVGHRRIDSEWWYPELELRAIPEKMFRLSNPRGGKKGIVVRSPLAITPVPVPSVSYALYLGKETKPRLWMPVLNNVSYAPVRAFGSALGLDTEYDPKTHSIKYDSEDQPVALKMIAGVGHAPIRQLAKEVGLQVRFEPGKVTVYRGA